MTGPAPVRRQETPDSSAGGGAGLGSVLLDDLLKWERSLTVAVWEGKPVVAERYRRQRDAARADLEALVATIGTASAAHQRAAR